MDPDGTKKGMGGVMDEPQGSTDVGQSQNLPDETPAEESTPSPSAERETSQAVPDVPPPPPSEPSFNIGESPLEESSEEETSGSQLGSMEPEDSSSVPPAEPTTEPTSYPDDQGSEDEGEGTGSFGPGGVGGAGNI